MTKICGVILAGGLARRMGGGDKSLNLLDGQPILNHVISRLKPQVSAVALNANGDAVRFSNYGLPVIADTEPDYPGPLAGILAGMEWAKGHGADHVVSVAADTPFFPTDLVERLNAKLSASARITIASTMDPTKGEMRHPTFALWPVDLADDLRVALQGGTRKIVAWADQRGTANALFDFQTHDPFFNINRPEDMVAAEQMIGATK